MLHYPNHYLDAHHSRVCHVIYTAYPNGAVWALWYMEKRSDGTIQLCSEHYSDSCLEAYHVHRWAKVTPRSGIWSKLRIYQPSISETRKFNAIVTCLSNFGGKLE